MPENPFTIQLVFAALIALLGGGVRGYSGFGSGMVMVPLMALMWGPVDAIAVVVGSGIIGSAPLAVTSIKKANWHTLTPLLITALIFVPIGGLMLVTLDPVLIKRVIASIILIAALVQMSGWKYTGPRGMVPGGIAGAISGWANGISAVGGPPSVMYLISLPDSPLVQRANIALTIYAHGTLLALTLPFSGRFVLVTIMWSALILPTYLLGVWGGSKLFRVLPEKIFRWVVLTMLVGLSLLILIG